MSYKNVSNCVKLVIAQTEFIGGAINKHIADDLSDRIFKKTGFRISKETLWNAFRKRLKSEDLSDEEKNAIAQFAGFINWEAYEESLTDKLIQKDKIPYKGVFFTLLFILTIYGILYLIKSLFL